jgi:hypothetical protein
MAPLVAVRTPAVLYSPDRKAQKKREQEWEWSECVDLSIKVKEVDVNDGVDVAARWSAEYEWSARCRCISSRQHHSVIESGDHTS